MRTGPLHPSSSRFFPFIAPFSLPLSQQPSNNGDTCRAGALAHQGIILQPSFLVGQDLAQGTLVELCPGYCALEMGIYAVYGSRKHVAPKLRLLIDFLAAHFAAPRWPG